MNQREQDLEDALWALVTLYVKNRGEVDEYITTITPEPVSSLTFGQRLNSKVWRAFDKARCLLGDPIP